LPCIYNPLLTFEEFRKRDPSLVLMQIQSGLLPYGSFAWMVWLARKIELSDYNQETLTFFGRIVADKEMCLRDETLIKRMSTAFAEAKLVINSNLNQ
ncbi:hypothetical protein PFISCL1PPCAC_4793, partial [Pristionchus fissidentatus]